MLYICYIYAIYISDIYIYICNMAPAARSRLEDLSDDGRLVRQHSFKVGQKTVNRAVGQHARGLMSQWVKLRRSLGKDQFLTTRVWCQPAAWSDEVISCWISDLVHEYQKQCITVLDCFSGQWTETSLFTAWLNSQMQLPIGPDCTPLLQVTGTCQSAQGKAAGNQTKQQLRLQGMEVARREKTQYQCKFGPYELFQVATSIGHQGTVMQKTHDLVLHQCRKSQLLLLRPSGPQLQVVDDQSWAKAFPRSPHQCGLQQQWVDSRLSAVNLDSMVPAVPDWSQLDGPAFESDFASADPGPDDVQLDDVELPEDMTVEDREMLRPPAERWSQVALPPQLKSQITRKSKEKSSSRWARKLTGTWSRSSSSSWKSAASIPDFQKPIPSAKRNDQDDQNQKSSSNKNAVTTRARMPVTG